MKRWFTVVEYLRCPYCGMIFDPKGSKIENGDGIADEDEEYYDETDEVIACKFCNKKAGIDFGQKERRI